MFDGKNAWKLIKKELETTQKALYLACNGNEYIMELYLNEAGKREDDNGRREEHQGD